MQMLCYCNIIYTHVNRISKKNSIRMKSKLHMSPRTFMFDINQNCRIWDISHTYLYRYNLHVNFLNPIHVHLHPVNKAWNCVHNWHPCACAMNVQRTLLTPKYGICVLFIVARIIKTRKNEQLCDQFWYHHREKNWY